VCQWWPPTVHAPVLWLYLIRSYGYLYVYLYSYSFLQFSYLYLYLCCGYLIQVCFPGNRKNITNYRICARQQGSYSRTHSYPERQPVTATFQELLHFIKLAKIITTYKHDQLLLPQLSLLCVVTARLAASSKGLHRRSFVTAEADALPIIQPTLSKH